jgi:hypothetical protein
MNDTLFNIYVETKNLIKQFEQSEHVTDEGRLLLSQWNGFIDILDKMDSNYSDRYERLIKNQESFTPEQIDFICYQIGEWYMEWKDRIICDLKQGQHRLGYAKEQLKSMICGN